MRALVPGCLFGTFACAAGSDPHDHAEHEDPRPDLSVTIYEAGLELFVEYPSFVAGMESPLVAHFTDARDPEGFVWITEGRVAATLGFADGAEEVFVTDRLHRNGIFKPIVKPSRPGGAELTLALTGPQAEGVVHVGPVVVHATPEAAVAAAVEEEPSEPVVAYLKETQWKTRYATAAAERRTLRASVRATGEIRAPAGRAAAIASPFAGRFDAERGILPGQEVHEGDVLGRIVPFANDPSALAADRARAEADLVLADRAADRAQRLYPTFVSARERDEALTELEAARARVAALTRGLASWGGSGGAGYEIRAPFAGRVAFVHADPGDVLKEGSPVVSFVDATELWLEARVFESDVRAVRDSPGAMITVTGRDEPVLIDASTGGRRIAVGAAVDPNDRTVPYVFAFPNPGDLLPGSIVKVRVLGAESHEAVAIPSTAVIDDGGLPSVFVLEGGESFFERRVTVGIRDGAYVEIVEGVAEGERVVSRGAWELHLATSAGGIPEHGHQH